MKSLPTSFLNLPPIREFCEHLSSSKRIYLRKDARIVFVCGATSTHNRISQRARLLENFNRHLPQFRFFRAEEVFEALGGQSAIDLLTIEGDLCGYSDCIIIICESESAFAELGAFALNNDLIKQLLVINDIRFRHSTSFINLGPIAKADKYSIFTPTVYANFEAISLAIPQIIQRLDKIPHSRRQQLSIGDSQFLELSSKQRLLLVADIVSLLGPVTKMELVHVLKASTSITSSVPLDTELALGVSLNLISKTTTSDNQVFYFHSLNEPSVFIDYPFNRSAMRAQIIRNYMQKDKPRIRELVHAIK
jgi:hypothetical protein